VTEIKTRKNFNILPLAALTCLAFFSTPPISEFF